MDLAERGGGETLEGKRERKLYSVYLVCESNLCLIKGENTSKRNSRTPQTNQLF